MNDTRKEGWVGFSNSKNYHYFAEGRSLCRNWGFPNYDEMTEDTGNAELQRGDCPTCFRKLLKRRKDLGVTKIEWKTLGIEDTSKVRGEKE